MNIYIFNENTEERKKKKKERIVGGDGRFVAPEYRGYSPRDPLQLLGPSSP